MPLVNAVIGYTAKHEAIEILVKILSIIITDIGKTPKYDGTILFIKIDINDEFWRMICRTGADWNFAFVLPGESKEEKKLVVPILLKMEWTLPPIYFCTDTETEIDVAEQYSNSLHG